MSPGEYLIVHDYTSLGWAGADRAVDDFFADKPECVVAIPDSAGSAVVRRQRAGGHASNWIPNRQVLAPSAWLDFRGGSGAYILQEGWSSAEDWGVWGVGPKHTLKFVVGTPEAAEMAIEIDAHTYIPPESASRSFDVLINGAVVLNMIFTREENRAIRKINIWIDPRETITLSFFSTAIFVPASVDPATTEVRPLGIALHKLRLICG